MRRIVFVIVLGWMITLVVLFAVRIAAADVPIRVEGKTETVVTELPFWLHAPTTADLYFWTVPPGVEYQDKGDTLLVTKCPEGRHAFRIKTISVRWEDKKLVTDTGTKVLVMGKVLPDPPEPDPGPDPKPKPVIKDLYLLVIEETRDAANDRGVWLGYKPLTDLFARPNYHWRIVDKDVKDVTGKTPEWLQTYLSHADKLPAVFLANQDGRILHSGPLPAGPADLVKIIREVTE